ncbi:MAG: hydroxyethylthiazole kinase [Rickettsiales bacterium]|jgi:hydroxyethylthiazole kinase|nr:hydroxyethylthiazole kinase [Rickettsiales bacterium]
MEKILFLLDEVRESKPLVHHITNYVTVTNCANATLAICGSPIMADDIKEVEEIVSISKALVINIGTLNERTVKSMLVAGKKANKMGIPVIFDPVGAGASKLRNNAIAKLLSNVRMSVIRGNISEIRHIAGDTTRIEGVNASDSDLIRKLHDNINTVKTCSRKYGCIASISGAVDIITDGDKIFTVANGHSVMSKITGTGCMLTSLIASFCGVTTDYLMATVAAVASMGVAGEIAFEKAGNFGTGTFNAALLDAISMLSADILKNRVKLDEIQDRL